jgi:hypothetical protein
MAVFLSELRARGPRLWGVRLLLGVALLGLLLSEIWRGEIHSHDNGVAAHSHGHDHATPEPSPQTDGSLAQSLHIHDAAVAVVMPAPPADGSALQNMSAAWLPDDLAVHGPQFFFNTPHRPPIA